MKNWFLLLYGTVFLFLCTIEILNLFFKIHVISFKSSNSYRSGNKYWQILAEVMCLMPMSWPLAGTLGLKDSSVHPIHLLIHYYKELIQNKMILDIPSMVEWWERWQVPWCGASFIIMGPQGLYNGDPVHTDPLTTAVIFSWKVRTIYWKKIQQKCDFPLRILWFAALVNKIKHLSYNNYTYCLTLWFTVFSN